MHYKNKFFFLPSLHIILHLSVPDCLQSLKAAIDGSNLSWISRNRAKIRTRYGQAECIQPGWVQPACQILHAVIVSGCFSH